MYGWVNQLQYRVPLKMVVILIGFVGGMLKRRENDSSQAGKVDLFQLACN